MKHMRTAVQAASTVALIFGAAFHAAQAQLAPPPKLLLQVTPKPSANANANANAIGGAHDGAVAHRSTRLV